MRVALLGLGVMGHGMARQLSAHGHALSVYNRSRERAADLEAAGVRVAGTPREAVRDAEALISKAPGVGSAIISSWRGWWRPSPRGSRWMSAWRWPWGTTTKAS